MKLRAAHYLSSLAVTAACGIGAQTLPAPASTPQAVSVRTPPELPYVDRLIDAGQLPALRITSDNDDEDYDGSGLPRYLRVEAMASHANQQGPYRHEYGVAASGRIETADYGALSLEAVLRQQPHGTFVSLIQRAMPFDNGWYANNSAGMIYTPTLRLARNQYRFYLPTFPVAGVSTEWLQGGAQDQQLQLQFGTGQPGVFDGLRLSGFSRLGGALTTAGAQWALSPALQAGLQLADARQVSTVALSGALKGSNVGPGFSSSVSSSLSNTTAASLNARSLYAGAVWHDDNNEVQANLVSSSVNQGSTAQGLWIDASSITERMSHHYGLFRLEPNLTWGYTPISSDVEGFYYRGAYRSRQWLLDGGFDRARSLSGNGLDGTLYTGSARYQISRDWGTGGSASYRHASQDAFTGNVFVDQVNAYGVGRMQLDHSVQNKDRLTRLSVDQSWDRPTGSRLTTTLSIGQEENNSQAVQQRYQHIGASLSGGGDLFNDLSWDGSLGYDTTTGAQAIRSISANIGVIARLSSRWSLSASYFDNRSENSNLFVISPLIPVAQPQVVVRSRLVFVSLRFEERAGTRTAPLGGSVGSGAGSIVGRLFLDANDNGIQDANEPGAASVTLLLDDRFATRTDVQGRYEFAAVASGTHNITVIPDNLPLPWAAPNQGRINVTVRTRQTTNADIAATRFR